ncbi:MAG: hypothetical protein CMI12_14425 [Oceanospirillum sp.]|nr:hypothetical protein [Oceanospirillum sp.]
MDTEFYQREKRMLKRLLTGFVLAGLLTSLPILADERDNKRVITVTYANQWKPYSYGNKEGQAKGILVDIVDFILHQKMGFTVQHIPLPWERAQNMVRNGSYDALITAPTAERQFYFKRTNSTLYRLQWRAYLSTQSSNYQRLKGADNPLTIRDVSCVSLLGDRTSESLYRRFNLDCQSVKDLPLALKMMQMGRVDLFVHSKAIVDQHMMSQNYMGLIEEHPMVLKKVPFVLMVSKYSPYADQLTDAVDRMVMDMAATGEYERFLSKLSQDQAAESD